MDASLHQAHQVAESAGGADALLMVKRAENACASPEVSGVSDAQMPQALYVLGRDISHSLSPVLHRAAFLAFDLPWTYEIWDAPTERDVRTLIAHAAFCALNVTTPYKGLAKQLATKFALDTAQDTAQITCSGADGAHAMTQTVGSGADGAHSAAPTSCSGIDLSRFDVRDLPGANVLINVCGALFAYNTDGEGARVFLESAGVPLKGARVVICGTGATAHAMARSLKTAQVAEVCLLSRSQSGSASGVSIARYDQAKTLIAQADVVINATPLGMKPGDVLPFSAGLLRERHIVFDAIYGHGQTPFAAAAAAQGCTFFDGRGMLVNQAAFSLQLVLAHCCTCYPSFEELRQVMLAAL